MRTIRLPLKRERAGQFAIVAAIAVLCFCMAKCGAGGTGSTSPITNPPGVSTHSVTLTWQASISPEVTGYRVYRREVSSQSYQLLTSTPVSALKYEDFAVQAGQNLAYMVTAVDASGNESVPSSEVTVTIPN